MAFFHANQRGGGRVDVNADAAPVAESSTPSPEALVSAEEANAPVQEDTAKAPQDQQAASSDASGNQSRRHRRLN